ncbi:MAG: hypothetical protein WD512_06815, partial [Candidatus Paceibacterota bacterium]
MKIQDAVKEYVSLLIESRVIHSLIISSPPGFGKTSLILEEMNKLCYEQNEDYKYITGHITPMKFYEMLSESRTLKNGGLVILDDCDTLLTNKTSVGLLKSALSEANGKRMVTYDSRVIIEKEFNFEGKIIIITNHLNKNKVLLPLCDRSFVYDFELDKDELLVYIKEKLPEMYPDISLHNKIAIFDKIKR